MNPLNTARDIVTQFSAAPVLAQFLIKATLLLAVAWVLHFGLARANPRWRALLWRGVAVSLVLTAVWIPFLPGFNIRIDPSEPVFAAPAATMPSMVAETESRQPVSRIHSARGPASEERPAMTHPAVADGPSEAALSGKPSRPSLSWSMILLSIWALGTVSLTIRLVIALTKVAKLLRISQPADEQIVANIRRISAALGCRSRVQVRTSQVYAVPFQYGLWKPVVVLPERMCQPAFREQLPAVIVHELAHVRSRDFGWNAAIQAVTTVLWFHPLAWRVSSVHRAACDAVCDAVSASYIGDVQAYCRTLAQVALEGAASFSVLGMAMARTCDVRRRIARLQTRVFAAALSRRSVCGAAVAGLLSSVLLAGVRFAPAEQPIAVKHVELSAVTQQPVSQDVAGSAKMATLPGTDIYGDPLPPGALARLGTIRYRPDHDETLLPIAFSADNKTVVGMIEDMHNDGSIRSWDATNGKPVRRVRLNQALDTCDQAITSDGKIGAAFVDIRGPGDARAKEWLKWWDVATGRELASILGTEHDARTLAIAADGNIVVAADRNRPGTIRLWDWTAKRQTATYEAKEAVETVAISPDGKRVIFATWKRGVCLWEPASKQEPRTILKATKAFEPLRMEFSQDGQTIAVAGYKRDVKVLDASTLKVILSFDWPYPNPDKLAFSSDGKQLALADGGDSSSRVAVWDLPSGKLLHTFDRVSDYGVYGMAFSPNGRLLAVSADQVLLVWDLTTEKCLNADFVGHESFVEPVSFCGSSNTVATAGNDGTVRLWEARTGRQKMLIRHQGMIRGLAISPDGKLLASSAQIGVAGSDETGPVSIWDAGTGKQLFSLEHRPKMGAILRFSFSADGKRLAGEAADGKVRIWSTENGGLLKEGDLHVGNALDPFGVTLLDRGDGGFVSPNFDRVLVSISEKKFRILDVETGKELRTFGDDGKQKLKMAISPDGKLLLANEYIKSPDQYSSELHLWDIASGKEIWRYLIQPSSPLIQPMAFSADGKRFALSIAGTLREIRICDVPTGKILQTLKHDSQPRCLAFSADGRLLVAGMADGTAVTWELTRSASGH